MYDWNDLRHFLAVARTGSTLAASRVLKVDQTTTARRVSALEQALGVKLFERKRDGYVPTAAGQELIGAAGRVEAEAQAFADQASAASRRMSGIVRVTTNEGLANVIMAPALRAFRQLHPEVRVHLVVDERRLDVVHGAADVALRTGSRPAEAGLVGRRLSAMAWALYCSRDYADRQGCPSCCSEELSGHMIIGADGPIATLPASAWLSQAAAGAEMVTRSSSITNLISAAKAGLGITMLPCFLADSDPALVRCIGPIEGVHSDVWLLTREDLRDVPRVRAFVNFLATYVARMRHVLLGNAEQARGDGQLDENGTQPLP